VKRNTFFHFLAVFLGVFAVCYFGSLAVIGLAAPGGMYSPFIAKYFNVIGWLRDSLLWGTRTVLNLFNYPTYFENDIVLRKLNGNGIIMVYSCVGYGVMSFWTAFGAAYPQGLANKIKLIGFGLVAIWLINVCRLALVLVSTNSDFRFPIFDHHDWFTIISYCAIGLMMWWSVRAESRRDFKLTMEGKKNTITRDDLAH
jgi:exosortase/archaeosortase family protein